MDEWKPITTAPPLVACCEKCGRGFLSLPGDGRMVDWYHPANKWLASKADNYETCGGSIKPVRNTA